MCKYKCKYSVNTVLMCAVICWLILKLLLIKTLFNFNFCFVSEIVSGAVNKELQGIVSFLKEHGYFFPIYSNRCYPVFMRLNFQVEVLDFIFIF